MVHLWELELHTTWGYAHENMVLMEFLLLNVIEEAQREV